MHLSLGLHLDGQHGWQPANRLGSPYLGPQGLLNVLETRLGLLRADCGHSLRVLQYRDCLKQADTPTRFYHASFQVDPIGTAATLLGWRDVWHLHGWTGAAPAGRLGDLAAVEALAREVVFHSMGERLALVEAALLTQPSGITAVRLLDPLPVFPQRWQQVLALLPVQPADASTPAASPDCLLGKLQRALEAAHTGTEPAAKMTWVADGSLRVLRAETPMVAARWVSDALRVPQPLTALVVTAESGLLEATLDATAVARQGFLDPSPWAPALQVLPLALALVWEPLDVHALLQFLAHPLGPIPGRARRRLAEAMASCPGLGGESWRAAIEAAVNQDPATAERVRTAIAFWIEQPRYAPADGVPVALLIERTRALREDFRARRGDEVRAQTGATGAAQASAVMSALEALVEQGETRLTPRDLQVVIAEATGQGAPNFALQAEVGRVPAVTEPGALVEPFDRVIWSPLCAPSLPGRYPWSQGEIAALAQVGVVLPDLTAVLEWRARDWRRPILNARRELVLVLPPPAEEVHPLWQEIQWLIEGLTPEPVESGLGGNRRVEVPLAPLPARRRWWTLPADVRLPSRPMESYSSLDKFLNAPHQWVLQYAARLNPSELLAIGADNQLYGTLAHRLIERYFNEPGALAWQANVLDAWYARAFRQVVAEEGAVLQMRGRRADLERLRAVLGIALRELQRQLLAAGVEHVEPERALTGRFTGGALQGSADLVVRNRAGGWAIVDIKWGGGTYRQEELQAGRQLQLAVYGEMLHQATGAWPDVAFFILQSAKLLTLDTTFFPDGLVVKGGDPGTTPALWLQCQAGWTWRHAQLDAGRIELVLEDVEATDDSTPPTPAFSPKPSTYDDYAALTGWVD